MAENVLETRILLRYGTYEQWMNSEIILMQGEIAVAKITYGSTIASSDYRPQNTPPAIGLKVGDGVHYFYELPWVQGIAADVYSWAKASTPPSASQIPGLAEFVEQHSSGGGSGGGSGSSDTPIAARYYRLVEGIDDNANKHYLQYREADSDEWITDTTRVIDLSQLAKLSQWIGDDVEDYFTLYARIYSTVKTEINKLDVTDSYETGKVVVAISETDGKIIPQKRTFSFSDLTGTVSIDQGGTGLTSIGLDQILVGTNNGIFTTRTIETVLDDTVNLATNRAIKRYIDDKTAGLVGAMHYVGEASVEIDTKTNANVNPQISGYDFTKVQMGDVITYGYKEFVWAGSWHLLGDEGSYAVKGSITDADISADANISQSKIADLAQTLAGKVNIIEGKGLSTNDYTNEDRDKLLNIEAGAQVNAIEHIFVNDIERPITIINGEPKSIALSIDVFDEEHATKLDGIQAGAQVNAIDHIFVNGEERPITTINNLNKSVDIVFIPYTLAEQSKLSLIESEAQVNKIEKIIINNTEYTPDANKKISITLDQAALNLNVLEGATIPDGQGGTNDVDQSNKKLILEKIAVSGDVKDLKQTADTYIILDCGSSTTVI